MNHQHHNHDLIAKNSSSNAAEHHQHGTMKMYFHGGVDETVLFSSWHITSNAAMVWSCVGILICSILYEGLKVLREYLLQVEIARGCSRQRVLESRESLTGVLNGENDTGASIRCRCDDRGRSACVCPVGVVNQTNKPAPIKRIMALSHLLQSILHVIQVTVGYMLMLIAMTFNTYLFVSVVVGSGLGHFLFAWRRTSLMDCSEHCH